MSIVTYIGLNFEVEVSDEITDAPIEIGYGLSEEENRLSVKENISKRNLFMKYWTENIRFGK